MLLKLLIFNNNPNYPYSLSDLQVWPAIIDTLRAEVDIDTEGDTYKVFSMIQVPKGKIVIDDSFSMEDVFHIKNDLHVDLDLSFSDIREITSLYAFVIDMEEVDTYLMEMNVNVRKDAAWIEVVCFNVAYIIYYPFDLSRNISQKKDHTA